MPKVQIWGGISAQDAAQLRFLGIISTQGIIAMFESFFRLSYGHQNVGKFLCPHCKFECIFHPSQ